MQDKVLLKVEHLCKSYVNGRTETQILEDISLTINKGEFLSIMGPSGAGKSTLMNGMSGMDRITSGTVLFDNNNIAKLSEKKLSKLRLQSMGFVFQQMYMLKDLRIYDNIILPAYTLNAVSKDEIHKYADELIERLDISSIKDKFITEVSGGQLQRACICRALINKPNLVFADEPTGALNSKTSKEVMTILRELNSDGITIVMVSHDTKVSSYAKKVLYVVDGNIKGTIELDKSNTKFDAAERETALKQWLNEMDW